MPRMNLTDEEAAVVERFRLKNLEVMAFNEGLDRARALIETVVITYKGLPAEDSITRKDFIDRLYNISQAIQSERRSARL